MNEQNQDASGRWPRAVRPAGFFADTGSGDGVRSGRIDPEALIVAGGAATAGEPSAAIPAQSQRVRSPRDTELAPVPEQQAAGPELVRPYFRTRGRTRPELELPLEALVSTSHNGSDTAAVRVAEYRSICELCVETRSVAEVAACLRLPLGVARVLVADAAALELVVVHPAGHVTGDRPSAAFMERVLTGLREC